MVWYCIIGVLAAFGLLCALWTVFGGLLGSGRGGVLVCCCRDGQEVSLILRYSQLRGAGLLHCPMLVVGSPLTERERILLCRKHPGIEFCSPEELPARLELERKRFD